MQLTKLPKHLFQKKDDSYRTPMQITLISLHPKDGIFPICPRCKTPFEREYQAYCANCGQCLGWETFIKVVEDNNT